MEDEYIHNQNQVRLLTKRCPMATGSTSRLVRKGDNESHVVLEEITRICGTWCPLCEYIADTECIVGDKLQGRFRISCGGSVVEYLEKDISRDVFDNYIATVKKKYTNEINAIYDRQNKDNNLTRSLYQKRLEDLTSEVARLKQQIPEEPKWKKQIHILKHLIEIRLL